MEFNINNYLMKPTKMKNGLLLYPILFLEYEKYIKLVNKFILYDIKSINNLNRQEFERKRIYGEISRREKFKKIPMNHLYDVILNNINSNEILLKKYEELNSMSEQELRLIKEVCKKEGANEKLINLVNSVLDKSFMKKYNQIYKDQIENKKQFIELLKMITKGQIRFCDNEFYIKQNDDEYELNKSNFYEFRKITMEQNLVFEPRIAPNIESQENIDMNINAGKSGEERDLEAMICKIGLFSNIDLENITYYRLMIENEVVDKIIGNISSVIYRANGCTQKGDKPVDIINIDGHLCTKDNPYEIKGKMTTMEEVKKADKFDQSLGSM